MLLAAIATAEDRPTGHAGGRDKSIESAAEGYLDKYGYDARDFRPVPDRWRVGLPRWDRLKNASGFDVPYEFSGGPFDPYRQNRFKGDYPVFGQNTFLNITAISDTVWFEATTAGVIASNVKPV